MHWRASDDPWMRALVADPERQLEAVVYHQWTDSRHHVLAVDLVGRKFTFSNPSFQVIRGR